MNYYIADMHLFCKSQTQEGWLNFDNRPFKDTEEMHQHFLQEWNKQIIRAEDIIERSVTRIPMYHTLNTIKIDTNEKTVSMIAKEIKQL